MAFALKSKSHGKSQGADKSAHRPESARGLHSADSLSGFDMPVFQSPAAVLPGLPMIQTKLKTGEPTRFSQNGILQRKCACGGATGMSGECEKCGKKLPHGLQTKLKVNEPGDIYEQEADRIADQVMAPSAHPAASVAPPRIQRFSGVSNERMVEAPASVGQVLSSSGKPLEPALRQSMEQRLGHDFSGVRVHTGVNAQQSAQDVNAQAYTVGNNIVFGAGRFSPGTQAGRRLIAHELTHVAQQGASRMRLQRAPEEMKSTGRPSPGQCEPAPPRMPEPWKAGRKTKDKDVEIEYYLVTNPGYFCDMRPKTAAFIQYERKVWIRTVSGHEATLRIYATAELYPPFDLNKSDFQQLHAPAWSSLNWEVNVKYAEALAGSFSYWHAHPEGSRRSGGADLPLAENAKQQGRPFINFGLSPAQQRQTLEDFVEKGAQAEIKEYHKRLEEWKKKHPPQIKTPPRQPIPPPDKPRVSTSIGKPKDQEKVVKTADEAVAQVIENDSQATEAHVDEEAKKKDESDPWYAGLLRALAAIGIGLLILAAVAAVVVGVVFAFTGVVISIAAAVVIAGIILLVYGFVSAFRSRGDQSAYKGRLGARIGRAVLDAIGVTGIQEA